MNSERIERCASDLLSTDSFLRRAVQAVNRKVEILYTKRTIINENFHFYAKLKFSNH